MLSHRQIGDSGSGIRQLRRYLIIAAANFLVTAVILAAFQPRSTLADYTFETNHPYLMDYYGAKAYRGTLVTLGNWNSGVFSTLPVTNVQAYSNIFYSQYSFSQLVFHIQATELPDDYTYRNASITYDSTPRYDIRWYWYYIDTHNDVALTTGACQSGGECATLYGSAWIEVIAPYNNNNPYQGGSGTATN